MIFSIESFLNIHLQREEELLSSWWKEYAECSEGPRGRPSSSMVDKRQSGPSLEGARLAQLYEPEEERVGVPVKGGLYEVSFIKKKKFHVSAFYESFSL
jgi:hypothetical protein